MEKFRHVVFLGKIPPCNVAGIIYALRSMEERALPDLDRLDADAKYVADPGVPGKAFRSQWIGDGCPDDG